MMGAPLSHVDISKTYHILSVCEVILLSAALKRTSWAVPVARLQFPINTGTYYVTAINYTGSYFWVMDPNFNTSSSCPLPLWNHVPYTGYLVGSDSVSPPGFRYLVSRNYSIACFANCSRAVTNNSAYKPVACLSANNSHVYVWVSGYGCMVQDLEPYCGYLAKIPFSNEYSLDWLQLENASYADITQFISKGFTVRFPVDTRGASASVKLRKNINICLNNSIR